MTSVTEASLAFENVTVRHGRKVLALEDVSFTIPTGAFCVVLGPSGAGKSTLLRTINGLNPIDQGRVLVGEEIVDRRTIARLRPSISMVYQSFNLVGRSSVAANVAAGALPRLSFWRSMAGLYPASMRTRACELIQAVGLDQSHMGRRVEHLSGGQQQRVGVARAFMLSPSIVLADEPVASLDPHTGHDILQLIRDEARASNATVLCSLHQLDMAREFANWIVALRNGRVQFSGAAQDFWDSPEASQSLYGEAA